MESDRGEHAFDHGAELCPRLVQFDEQPVDSSL